MNEPTMETLTRRLDQVEKNEEVDCGLVAFLGIMPGSTVGSMVVEWLDFIETG